MAAARDTRTITDDWSSVWHEVMIVRVSSQEPLISVLMTSHNRRDQTLACLTRLFNQRGRHNLEVFLVDDASSDGTGDEVRSNFPVVHVIPGSGSLFWSGGMRVAQREASKVESDFILWLNDDVLLVPTALTCLLESYYSGVRHYGNALLVVGALKDPKINATTYSGLARASALRPLKFKTVEPSMEPLGCDTMNGNVVLIPRRVADNLGSIDQAFTHAIGDIDYGLRARKANCKIILAPGYVGSCPRHPTTDPHLDTSMPLTRRFRNLASTKVIPPRSWASFARRHGGPFWPLFWVSPYVRLLVSSIPSLGRRSHPTES